MAFRRGKKKQATGFSRETLSYTYSASSPGQLRPISPRDLPQSSSEPVTRMPAKWKAEGLTQPPHMKSQGPGRSTQGRFCPWPCWHPHNFLSQNGAEVPKGQKIPRKPTVITSRWQRADSQRKPSEAQGMKNLTPMK